LSVVDFLSKQEKEELLAEAGGEKKKHRTRQATIVSLADVEPEEVPWLWEPYIPLSKLTILEGDPAAGKTFVGLAIASAISNGRGLLAQDGRPGPPFVPGNVLYLTAEDGLADTIRPRLDSLGADVKRVFSVLPAADGENVSLADVVELDLIAAQIKPRLIVIDPLQAYLGAGIDMHRANETRPVLSRLAWLAEKHKCAVLCLRHLTKAPTGRAIYRGMGSIDFTAAARSVLLAGVDPADEGRRALVQIKSSLAPIGVAIGYTLTQKEGFLWAGVSSLTKGDLLAGDRILVDEEKTALREACDFLQDILADGPVDSKQIKKEARKAGIAEKTLHRAKSQCGITAKKIGHEKWVWQLEEAF